MSEQLSTAVNLCKPMQALLLVLMAVTPVLADQTWGGVVYVEGEARVSRPLEGITRELRKREKLHPGDQIAADQGARVVLLLFAKSLVDVDGPASLQILERGVALWNGRVASTIFSELLKDDEVYEIRGRDVVAEFRGTASMEVESSPGMGGASSEMITTICAERGAVRISLTRGARISLGPEECVRIEGESQRVERRPSPRPGGPNAGPLPRLHP
jgi:hypothetical protein